MQSDRFIVRAVIATGLVVGLALVPVARAEFAKGPAIHSLAGDRAVIFVHSDREEVTLEWGLSQTYDQVLTLTSGSGEQPGFRVWQKQIDLVLAGFVIGEKDGWIYEFELSDLVVDTTYHYRVTNAAAGIQPEEVTEDLTFTTAPEPGGRFVFVVTGDNKASPDYVQGVPLGSNLPCRRIADLIAPDEEIRMFAGTGDIVTDSNPDANWSALYRLRRDMYTRVAWFPSMGNHDFDQPDNGFNFQAYVHAPRTLLPGGAGLPTNDHNGADDTELFYSYDFGGVHFIAFNANLDLTAGSPQHQFIVDDLLSHRCLGPIVAYGHHPWFSSAEEGGVSDTLAALYHPLFVEHGVDMVFFGHRHFYERMDPDRLDGILYMVAGGAGSSFDDIMNPPRDYSLVADTIHHYVRFQVDGWDTFGQAIDQFGNLFDEFELLDMYLNDPIDCRWDPGQQDGGPSDGGVDGSDGEGEDAGEEDGGVVEDAGTDAGEDGGGGTDEEQDGGGEDAGEDAGADGGPPGDEGVEPGDDGGSEPPADQPSGTDHGLGSEDPGGCGCGRSPAGSLAFGLVLVFFVLLRRRVSRLMA